MSFHYSYASKQLHYEDVIDIMTQSYSDANMI